MRFGHVNHRCSPILTNITNFILEHIHGMGFKVWVLLRSSLASYILKRFGMCYFSLPKFFCEFIANVFTDRTYLVRSAFSDLLDRLKLMTVCHY